MPQEIRELDYDQYRDIRFRPEKALWRAEKLPFELMFFLQGRDVPEPVRINVVEPSGERPSPFDPALFDFGKNQIDADKLRDSASTAFASTTRSTSRATRTRCSSSRARATSAPSARGRATACRRAASRSTPPAPTGEEFPRFVEFWIERPRANATSLTIYALLDSRRVAGAYRFVLTPGVETTMQVTARLFLRERDRQARPGAADQHVRLRREPAGPRRLPARGARLRRPVDPGRRRRVDLAAAGQSAAPARHLVRARPTRAASA